MLQMLKNTDYEILTPDGYSDFDGVSMKIVESIVRVKFNDGSFIRCTNNHLIKCHNGEFIEADKLSIGTLIYGEKTVTEIVPETGSFKVFDPINVHLNHEYLSNDITSHNCAFINHAETIWTAAQSTLSTGGQAIILSTPNGVGNFFHKTWIGAKEAGFNTIKLHWSVHPDRNHQWRREQDKILGTDQAAQECVSGDTLVTVRNERTGEIETLSIDDLRQKMNI